MAEHLKPAVAAFVGSISDSIPGLISASVLTAIMALMPVSAAIAEELPDPTRPPAGFGQNQGETGAPAGPVLQSILISPTRRIAIISGKTVKAGDKFGDARVVAINANDVILKSGKSQQVLKLYPSLHNPVSIRPTGGNLEVPGQSR
jgi:MSHA biogenesis protein MshK